ncbi:MAG TPA: tetratricopeptide repeat-containing serine protease family protein, partial [Anaerolineales bacterium]|nr:tetratricopeptide repeat-containing serine protease family protein [Anaerolineales bacterium]
KAVEWWQKAAAQWQKAAAQGQADAQFNLGRMYDRGEGVPKGAAKAVEWWQKASSSGNADAAYNLGLMYSVGGDVPKDAAKAVEWWQKAAALGHADAQHSLGFKYYLGDGVPKDSVLAYAWANLAAARGSKGASHLRDVIITLSSAQRAEAERLSSNWKPGQVLQREGESDSSAGNASSGGGTLAKKGTGTAFVVSTEGHAVTNHHVVAGCKELRVQGRSESILLITRDAVSDLALLKMPGETRAAAALTPDPASLRQGQDIVVFGFPLDSVLSSGGNLTPGVVSAITGLGNNSNQIQITAPIQPGSSGSPVMDKKGHVVGVVNMKLSDSAMAKATGSLPQNVNFAVNGQTLKAFLDANRVPYKTGGSLFAWEKSLADLGDEARKWTTVVECWK